MSKNFKDSFYNTVTAFAVVPIGLVTAILVARLLGPHSKGVFNFLPLIMGIGVYIFQFGCGAGVIYYVSSKQYRSEDVAGSAILNSLVQGIVLAAILWLLFKLGAFSILSDNLSDTLFLLFLSAVPVEAVFLTVDRQLTAIGQFRVINRLIVFNHLLFLISFLVFVYVFDLDLRGAVFAFVIQKYLFQGFVIIRAWRLLEARWTLHPGFIRHCYGYGIRAWMGNMANRANAKLDGLLIGLYLPASSLGIYNIGYQMINYVNMAFNGAYKVFFNKISAMDDQEQQLDLFYRIHRIFLALGVAMIIALWLVGHWLILLFFGEDFSSAYMVMVILSVGILPYATTRRLVQKYMSALGKPLSASKIEVVTALTGLALYFVLIPAYGMNGAAVATSVAFLVGSVYAFYLLIRYQKISASKMLIPQRSDINYLKVNLRKLSGKNKSTD